MPGPYPSPADFAADHIACAAQANQQLAPAVAAANNQVAGTAVLNMMTGTGANAVDVNTQATATLQQQYDADYGACMYARGDNVPGYYQQPVYYAEPIPTEPRRRRVAHRRSPKKAASPALSGQAAGPGFIVPTPTAASAGGSGFVEPAPVATSAARAGGGFVQPTPSSMH
ncbi:MAG: hypothetical protein ACREEZ_02405 [Stellaceae bacterium]